MPDRPLTILQLTHQGGPAGSTQSIFGLSQHLARRGHRVVVGCREDTLLARLAREAAPRALGRRLPPRGRLRAVRNGLALEPVDAPVPPADLATARAALGDVAGRPVVAVVARRKDQDVLLRALPGVEQPLVLALVGLEADERLRALAGAVPARHRAVFVPPPDRPA